MAMGMSYHDFWHGDCTQWKFWKEQHQIRKKWENEMLWLQGFYVFDALTAAMTNAFQKKGKPAAKYREEPIRITPMTEEDEEAEKQKQIDEFRASLNALGRRFEAKHKRERGE